MAYLGILCIFSYSYNGNNLPINKHVYISISAEGADSLRFKSLYQT